MTELREHGFDIVLRDGRRRRATLLHGEAWGEMSPLPGYDCEPEAARMAATEAAFGEWPAPIRTSIPVNALVDSDVIDAEALRGYSTIKIKVGDAGDIDRVARVRDVVGASVALRVDANGAWDEATAIERIAAMARFDLEYAEEPVHGLDALARVRRAVDVPIAADESIRGLTDALTVRARDAVDLIVLKVQPCGGVHEALRWADAAGVPAVVTSMMETSIGIRAGVALAAALPELPYACGLATATALVHDAVVDPLVALDGAIPVRDVTVRISE